MMILNCIEAIGLGMKSFRLVLKAGGMGGFGVEEGVAGEKEDSRGPDG